MLKEGETWMGDVLKITININNEQQQTDQKIDKIDLLISKEAKKNFDNFTQETIKAGQKLVDLNTWQKSKLSYNGKNFDIKIKLHGDCVGHFENKAKSYKIKLLNNKKNVELAEFSLILFSDRPHYPTITQFFAKKLNLNILNNKIVMASTDKKEYDLYYLREEYSKETLEKKGFSNSTFIKKTLYPDGENFRYRIHAKGGGHQTILDYEPSKHKILSEITNEQKVNAVLYHLRNQLEKKTDFPFFLFDRQYLINFETLRAILKNTHDSEGDNLPFIYRETNGKLYPVVPAESMLGYSSNLIDAEITRFNSGNTKISFGDDILLFKKLNQNDKFRQEKYQNIFKMVSDDNQIRQLITHIKKSYNAILKNQNKLTDTFHNQLLFESLSKTILNINLLKYELSYSKLPILIKHSPYQTSLEFTPISISELNINKLILNYEKEFPNNKEIEIVITNNSKTTKKTLKTNKNAINLSQISDEINSNLFLKLNDKMIPVLNKTKIQINHPVNTFKNSEISVNNTVSNKPLEQEKNIFIYKNDKKYTDEIQKHYQRYTDQFDPKEIDFRVLKDTKKFNKNLLKNSKLLQLKYQQLWNSINNNQPINTNQIKSNFYSTLLTLPRYQNNLPEQDTLELINFELSTSKSLFNIIQQSNELNLEMLPISVSTLKFDKIIFSLSTPLPQNQTIKLNITNENNQTIFSNQITIEKDEKNIDLTDLFKGFVFCNDIDDSLHIKKTRLNGKITFQNINQNINLNSVTLKLTNTTTKQPLNDKDISIALINNNNFYYPETLYKPEQTFKKYKIFDLEKPKKLILKNHIDITENIIIPHNTELIIQPDTNINMSTNTSIISYSKVTAKGTKEKPITIKSSDPEKPFGVFALANEDASNSIFEYVNFENGSESYINGIYFSGMFSAYHNNDIIIKNCSFKNAKADDALNFKYSNSSIYDSYFSDNSADAIDYDFMSGEISNNIFIKNGNDSIDTSGSTTLIKNNYIYFSGDKGISFGEKTKAIVINNVIDSCRIGIECKDSSNSISINNVIANNSVSAINSYQKKEIFSSANCEFYNTLLSTNKQDITFINTLTGKKLKTDKSKITIENSVIPSNYGPIKNYNTKINYNKLKNNNWIYQKL
ncbi:right-handed parallel beta-helix repeat-containing protein, partial [Patescibacteria group bacterium]|nr:right-handed parallel beta-helix repeat-containing protein [Patescibacteria group bacterium]